MKAVLIVLIVCTVVHVCTGVSNWRHYSQCAKYTQCTYNECKSQKKYNRRVGRYTYWCYKCKLDGSDCETRRLRAQDSWYDEEEELYSNRRSLRSPYEDEEVGGGKIYGEYNKGPVKVGGEWNFDETEENVGGFSVYGEYEKGPVKVGGEWDFDEEGDEDIGWKKDLTKPWNPCPGCGQWRL